MLGGYENRPVLHLVPVQGAPGVDLPAELYRRWKNARAELDAVQRAVVAHLREHGGHDAIPEALGEARDRQPPVGRSTLPWGSE
jgi:hypothetical protein